MSSRKNGYGPDAFEYLTGYIDVEIENIKIVELREQVAALDKKIEELEDEIYKLNKINMELRDTLTREILNQ